ncbi:hypothetical protein IVB22_33495 [Bradyrhizobium sp. 190]|uniref:hypothetical protein n=1 Tax=Bradyrhizobium sp. 190 TaxID=2782658 RepID=UPI001FFA263B|nr:hypothetical protein [Bradyrhizobium sp. 190]MCK1517335.1 hypothetical protein [Bradyrhizobium sp. 190]
MNDNQAIEALQIVMRRWMERSGLEALVIWQGIERASAAGPPIDAWVLDPNADPIQAAAAARKVLRTFVEDGHLRTFDFAALTKDGINDISLARGQVVDPMSVAVVGTLAIALVLAARIKRMNASGIEFYEGLPPGLEKILKVVSANVS